MAHIRPGRHFLLREIARPNDFSLQIFRGAMNCRRVKNERHIRPKNSESGSAKRSPSIVLILWMGALRNRKALHPLFGLQDLFQRNRKKMLVKMPKEAACGGVR